MKYELCPVSIHPRHHYSHRVSPCTHSPSGQHLRIICYSRHFVLTRSVVRFPHCRFRGAFQNDTVSLASHRRSTVGVYTKRIRELIKPLGKRERFDRMAIAVSSSICKHWRRRPSKQMNSKVIRFPSPPPPPRLLLLP